MPRYQGIEYAIRWKGEWEWEVFAHPNDAIGIVHGTVKITVISPDEDFRQEEWRQIAVAGVRAAIRTLLQKGLVTKPP